MKLRFVAAAAAVLLLNGCATMPGPLVLGTNTEQCAFSDQHTEILAGLPLSNPDSTDMTLDRVTFASHEGITVLDVWLVDADPQDDGTTLGYGYEAFPPDASTRPSWADRVDAEGATLPAGHDSFLAFHLRRTSADVVADGLSIDYTLGGRSYTATTNTRFGFSSDNSDCTLPD